MFGGNVWECARGTLRIPMQNYKYLCAVVMICATLVNTQTHRQLFSAILSARPAKRIIVVIAGCVSVVLLLMSILAIIISTMDPAESHSTISVLSQVLLQTLISCRGRLALRRLQHASSHLASTQTTLLLSILKHNAKTNFGRRNHFADVLAAVHGGERGAMEALRRSFVANVPLTTHDDYVADIERLLEYKDAPAAGILTSDRVEFLCYSSGTTGKNKLFPVTRWPKVIIHCSCISFCYSSCFNVICCPRFLVKEKITKTRLHER